jgi:Raf kinase inhibitor-like YbhB/YbcL family protein
MKTLISTLVVIILIVAGIYWIGNLRNPVVNNTNVNVNNNASTTVFTLRSSAFGDKESIPSEYTCEGANINPPLTISNIPSGTKSFALTMYDPDVPKQVRPEGFFDHWVIFNIPATTTTIAASSTVGVQGNNGGGRLGYTGPCPPTQYEPKEHRYIFTIYALDGNLNLSQGATREQVENATSSKVLGKAVLTGRYQKMATTTP